MRMTGTKLLVGLLERHEVWTIAGIPEGTMSQVFSGGEVIPRHTVASDRQRANSSTS